MTSSTTIEKKRGSRLLGALGRKRNWEKRKLCKGEKGILAKREIREKENWGEWKLEKRGILEKGKKEFGKKGNWEK